MPVATNSNDLRGSGKVAKEMEFRALVKRLLKRLSECRRMKVDWRSIGTRTVPILCIIALAFLMRLWPQGYVTYEYHSQEISLAAYRFVHEGEIPLYGYRNLDYFGHYGPVLIYLFSLFALLSTAPGSAVLFTIIMSTMTTYVLYRIGRDFWTRSAGFIAALLWATSHFAVITARHAYTVNLAPFFVSLFFYSLLALIHKRTPAYYGLLFFLLATILQLHVSAFPVLLLVIPAFVLGMPRSRKWLLVGCCILVILFLPYLYYEASNGFNETKLIMQSIRTFQGETKTTPLMRGWGGFLLQYVDPFEYTNYANPFLENIANKEFYFCEDPSYHSILVAGIGQALHMFSIIAWLLFLPVPPLFCWLLLRKRKESYSIGFKASILVLVWFFISLMLNMLFPSHFPHHFHSLFISTVLLWAAGWGWLLPSLAGRYKQAICFFVLLTMVSLVVINSLSWAAFHISNPMKDCISFFVYKKPTLSALEDIAEVLAEDQRFLELQDEDETLNQVLAYDMEDDRIYGLLFPIRDAVRRRREAGEEFANLPGKYILIREQSLPFRLAPALSEMRIGSYILIRQSSPVDSTSLVIAKAADTKDIESARMMAEGQAEPLALGDPWPTRDTVCFVECLGMDNRMPDYLCCLGDSTVYLRIIVNRNHTARTALVVNEFESGKIGAVFLNDEPLFYEDRLLVRGEMFQWGKQVMMDVTGRLNESQNVLEVLLFPRPGVQRGFQVRPDIFTLSGN